MDSNHSVSILEINKTTDSTANIVLTRILQIATIYSSLVNPRPTHAWLIDDLANQDDEELAFEPKDIAKGATAAVLTKKYGVSMNTSTSCECLLSPDHSSSSLVMRESGAASIAG